MRSLSGAVCGACPKESLGVGEGLPPHFPGVTDSRLVLPFCLPFDFLLPTEDRQDLRPQSQSLFAK